jgi:hypothetical protein
MALKEDLLTSDNILDRFKGLLPDKKDINNISLENSNVYRPFEIKINATTDNETYETKVKIWDSHVFLSGDTRDIKGIVEKNIGNLHPTNPSGIVELAKALSSDNIIGGFEDYFRNIQIESNKLEKFKKDTGITFNAIFPYDDMNVVVAYPSEDNFEYPIYVRDNVDHFLISDLQKIIEQNSINKNDLENYFIHSRDLKQTEDLICQIYEDIDRYCGLVEHDGKRYMTEWKNDFLESEDDRINLVRSLGTDNIGYKYHVSKYDLAKKDEEIIKTSMLISDDIYGYSVDISPYAVELHKDNIIGRVEQNGTFAVFLDGDIVEQFKEGEKIESNLLNNNYAQDLVKFNLNLKTMGNAMHDDIIQKSFEEGYLTMIEVKDINMKCEPSETFIIANARTGEEFIKNFETGMDCRHWIINNLDSSQKWEMESVDNLFQEHKDYCDKYDLEREFVYKDDIINNKGAIWEIRERSVERDMVSHLTILDGDDEGIKAKNIKQIEDILHNDESILLRDSKNDKLIDIELNYDGDLMYKIYDDKTTKLDDNFKIIKDFALQIHQHEKNGWIDFDWEKESLPIDSIDRIIKDVNDFSVAQKEYMPTIASKIDIGDLHDGYDHDLKSMMIKDAIRMYQLGNNDTSRDINDEKESRYISQAYKGEYLQIVCSAFHDGQKSFMDKVHKEVFAETQSKEQEEAFKTLDGLNKREDYK